MRHALRRTLWIALFLFAARPASAQFDTGSIVGTVRDATSAVVPQATITLTNVATGVSAATTTNREGNYEFFTVRPGTYLVTGEKAGFSVAVTDNVQAAVGGRLRVDLQMTGGQVTEKVEVSARAPLLETESSQRGQAIGGSQIREIALNGREYSSLALLATGARAPST
ncbi:MAG: carboxypeptidase-like regulatory domain-containing protein [Acidobacteriota bacterium]